ncbi:hypothetical protein [Leptolyngbya sp. FACHB-261]|uniref:hypothetical protein n=1 Tax=Leptolyngbya sp. FACHB-261 TaxID=2692806 RepID=UPI001682827F|nr:hypothetical protein [Leptolyngbya sp. FACHB-261]MBD2102839.1 hypothetical protein [Leptolyngbya sp. FACHB-261]
MSGLRDESNETGAPLSRATFSKFIEPAAITTIVVAATYYIGKTYISAYYSRLGLDVNSLDFPTSFYVQQSALPVLVGVIAIYLSFFLKGKYKNRRREALSGNILPFLAGFLILYVASQEIGADRVRYFSIAVIVLSATTLLTYLGVSFFQSIKTSFLFRLSALVSIFALFVLSAQILGNNSATNLIGGKYEEITRVRFVWDATPPPQELNSDLILLMQHKGNYYVVKQQSLDVQKSGIFPEIYIVPESKIRFAIIRRENR